MWWIVAAVSLGGVLGLLRWWDGRRRRRDQLEARQQLEQRLRS
jgi:hypothetical protein